MRGTIIHWDPVGSSGIISDSAGQRRDFQRSDWRSPEEPASGREVDFELDHERAANIYLLGSTMTGAGIPTSQSETGREATNYAIISLVCGGFGFMVWPVAIFAAVPAIIFGVKGKRLSSDLPDRSAYIMSIGGIVSGAILAALWLFFVAIFTTLVATSIWWDG